MSSNNNLSLFVSALSAITNTQVITCNDSLKSCDNDGDEILLKRDDLIKIFLPKILNLDMRKDLLDPQFNFDYEGIKQNIGGFEYKKPYGWKRIGLNVLDKYDNGNNEWIGFDDNRIRKHNTNEWPVSYHGTGKYNSNCIARDGYNLSKGTRFAYGHGIYSTPDIKIAERFAKTFEIRNHKYLIVVQNRVNPKTMKRIKIGVGIEYWISPDDKDIRPYAICYKKVD
nr:14974_t:CDS:2 [Entrophospora candida]CAG8615286.1 13789_t:CDS:2 [Entrophospora candida]